MPMNQNLEVSIRLLRGGNGLRSMTRFEALIPHCLRIYDCGNVNAYLESAQKKSSCHHS